MNKPATEPYKKEVLKPLFVPNFHPDVLEVLDKMAEEDITSRADVVRRILKKATKEFTLCRAAL